MSHDQSYDSRKYSMTHTIAISYGIQGGAEKEWCSIGSRTMSTFIPHVHCIKAADHMISHMTLAVTPVVHVVHMVVVQVASFFHHLLIQWQTIKASHIDITSGVAREYHHWKHQLTWLIATGDNSWTNSTNDWRILILPQHDLTVAANSKGWDSNTKHH